MTRRGFALVALGGTLALAALGARGIGTLNVLHVENRAENAPAIAERRAAAPVAAVITTATTVGEAMAGASNPPEAVATIAARVGEAAANDANALRSVSALVSALLGASAAAAPAIEPAVEPVLADPGPTPPTAPGMQLASVPPSAVVDDGLKSRLESPMRASEPSAPCVADACIDAYLWSLYERTPKIDTNKVSEQVKVTVKKRGKTRTVTHTVTSYVVADFTWKDPAAAQRAGMSLKDYVIGGMDRAFKVKLYHALHAMDDAGFMPGITSAFRDDYRQSIAAGNKAAADRSYHGGSLRGGYGHGLAADIVSVKGDTRLERFASSEELWKWIDAHEKELGVGRPYLDHDPPHVGPIDGVEFAVKRSLANLHRRAVEAKKANIARLKTTRQHAASPARQSTQIRQKRPT